MLVKPKNYKFYSSAYDFVKLNKLEKEFKNKFKITVEKWEELRTTSDDEVIEYFLKKDERKFMLEYNEYPETFVVYEFD